MLLLDACGGYSASICTPTGNAPNLGLAGTVFTVSRRDRAGAYTVAVSGAGDAVGTALFELYVVR